MTPEQVKRVSQDDQDLICRALHAAVDGPYFPEWEFGALIGIDRSEVAEILADWPNATVTTSWESDPAKVQRIAVNNVLNNLIGYPHGRWAELKLRLGADPHEVRALLEHWHASTI